MQIFPRSSNAIARASLFGAVFAVSALFWVLAQLQRSPYITYAGVRKSQPVPFSHQHHVTGLGIDCRYCHTSVEQSSFAGIPPTKTCMNCHSQIWTNAADARAGSRQLPNRRVDPVDARQPAAGLRLFQPQHSRRTRALAATPATGPWTRCRSCTRRHRLQMEWCLNCHRAPEKFLRPRDQVFNMRYQQPTASLPVQVDGTVYADQESLGFSTGKEIRAAYRAGHHEL